MSRYPLRQDREDAGLSLGQVAQLCRAEGRPELTVDRLRQVEAGAEDPEVAQWLRDTLYHPLPDDLRQALEEGDLDRLRSLGAVVCRCCP